MVCEGHFIRQAKIYYNQNYQNTPQTTRSASNKSMLNDSLRK